MTKIDELLPELKSWNNGQGINALDYVWTVFKPDVALAYASLFWPKFKVFESCILLEDVKEDYVKGWKSRADASRHQIEATCNYLDLGSLPVMLHQASDDLVERQIKYLRMILAAIYDVKLKHDFPDREFKIVLLDDEECAITFFQR